MLSIPKKYKTVELAADIIYQQVFMSQKLGHRTQNMAALLGSNWKLAGIDKNTKNNLLDQLQLFITASKKDTRYRTSTLDAI